MWLINSSFLICDVLVLVYCVQYLHDDASRDDVLDGVTNVHAHAVIACGGVTGDGADGQ